MTESTLETVTVSDPSPRGAGLLPLTANPWSESDFGYVATSTLGADIGQNLIRETTGGITSDYLYGPGIDEPLAMYKNGQLSYFNVDGLGSVVATNDPAGSVTHSVVFDAWGAQRAETGTRFHPFTYTGREVGEAGQLFYRARYYDPSLGRLTQEDPMGFESGDLSLYRYVRNQPAIGRDPMGLFTLDPSCNCLKNPPGVPGPSFHDLLQGRVGQACQLVASTITDPSLRACIEKSCKDGKIECRENCAKNEYAHNDFIFFGVINRHPYTCTNRWDTQFMDIMGGVMIHEFAHGCGWSHGGGAGVPFQSGAPSE